MILNYIVFLRFLASSDKQNSPSNPSQTFEGNNTMSSFNSNVLAVDQRIKQKLSIDNELTELSRDTEKPRSRNNSTGKNSYIENPVDYVSRSGRSIDRPPSLPPRSSSLPITENTRAFVEDEWESLLDILYYFNDLLAIDFPLMNDFVVESICTEIIQKTLLPSLFRSDPSFGQGITTLGIFISSYLIIRAEAE